MPIFVSQLYLSPTGVGAIRRGGEALHLCCNTLIIVKFIICIGSGKSVLAAESVRDPDIAVHVFPGGVFWVKVKR